MIQSEKNIKLFALLSDIESERVFSIFLICAWKQCKTDGAGLVLGCFFMP